MIKEFQQKLEEFKKSKDSELMTFDLETVQNYFAMQDTNKWLKFNAMNKEQLERAERFEQNLQSVLKNLYVPEYQSDNV